MIIPEELIGTLEQIMPRAWLTPDLRCQVAEWLVEQVREQPWSLTVSASGGCRCPRDPYDEVTPYDCVPSCPLHGVKEVQR